LVTTAVLEFKKQQQKTSPVRGGLGTTEGWHGSCSGKRMDYTPAELG